MKACFKCGLIKPLSEFYTHPRMADGHLNKCKACTRRDTAERVERLSLTDIAWVERELERHRHKSRSYRDQGRAKTNPVAASRWDARNKHKKRAHSKVNAAIRSGALKRLPCEVCGAGNAQAHHDDYSKPLNVAWLCVKHHAERHIELNRMKRLHIFGLNALENSAN
jgi:hypothetical protein